jgi:hypothetical protein
MNHILNGRVNLFDKNASTSKIDNNSPEFYNEKNISIINRNFAGNCVSEIFFAQENVNIIQEGIINSVCNNRDGEFRMILN